MKPNKKYHYMSHAVCLCIYFMPLPPREYFCYTGTVSPAARSVGDVLVADSHSHSPELSWSEWMHRGQTDIGKRHQGTELLPRNNSDSSLMDALETIDWEQVYDMSAQMEPRDLDEVSSIASSFETACSRSTQFSHREKQDQRLIVSSMEEQSTDSAPEIFLPSAGLNFKTLAEALMNARDYDEIHLSAGVYVEHGPLEISADHVVICAAKINTGEVEIRLQGPFSSLVCRGRGLKVSDLKIVHCSSSSSENTSAVSNTQDSPCGYVPACINVLSGEPSFLGCRITSSLMHGVVAWGDSTPVFKHCYIDKCADVAVLCRGRAGPIFVSNTFRKNKSFAVVIMDSCSGSFVGNVIVKNKKCAIVCGGTTTTSFLRNHINDGLQGGFWIQGLSRCSIVENKIRNNLKAGVQVSNQSNPSVKMNRIHGGQGGGIVIHDEARGTFVSNILEYSIRAGIGIMDNSMPVIVGNTIKANEGGGTVMTGSCSPIFAHNEFVENGFVGIGVKERATPIFNDNSINFNNGYGMLLQATSSAHVQGCKLIGNKRPGLCMCDESRAVIDHCLFEPGPDASTQDAQSIGMIMYDKSRATVRSSILRGHKSSNFVMQDMSVATLTSNEGSASDFGLKMHGHSSASLRHNFFASNKEANILISDHADFRATLNAFVDSGGCGVQALKNSRCILSHNSIMCNTGMGVEAFGRGTLEMRANRVSANAQYGIFVDGALCKLRANVIFGNQMEGLHLVHTPQPIVEGNCIMRGGGVAIFLEGPEITGVNVERFKGNLIQMDEGSHELFPSSFHKNNITTIEGGSREVVHHSLDVLQDWTMCRAGHVIIQMPDGGNCIAAPARHENKAFKLPEYQKPKSSKKNGKGRGSREG
jgi:parallel beta-helix repeat protein